MKSKIIVGHMYRKIIVGYDASEQAADALDLGKLVADLSTAELVVAGVFNFDPLWGDPGPDFREAEAEHARAVERAAESVNGTPEAIPSGSAGQGLHELAEEIQADLIVVGSAHHGRVGQILAGSVGMSLLHGSPCSVAIAPRGYAQRAQRSVAEVTLGYDGSSEAGLALLEAVELARAAGAKLRIVAVAEPPATPHGKSGTAGWRAVRQAIEEMLRERLDAAVESVPDDLHVEPVLVHGDPAGALAEIAGTGDGILIVGSRAYGPLRRVLLGSVSRALVRSAPCPLIIHPRPVKPEPAPTRPMEAGSGA